MFFLLGCSSENYDEGYENGYAKGEEDGRYIGYEDGYSDGYDEGYGDGYDNLNMDDAIYMTEEDGKYIVIDAYELGNLAGRAAGVFAEYPMEDNMWEFYRDNEDFEVNYLESYFDAYYFYSSYNDSDDFDPKAIAMINISEKADVVWEVGYDIVYEVLLMRLKDNCLYAFDDVGYDVFEAIIFAENIDKYVKDNIVDVYTYYKIEE